MKTYDEVYKVMALLCKHDIDCWWFADDNPAGIRCTLNMNDTFYWGTSDSEKVEMEDLPALEKAFADCIAAGGRGAVYCGDVLFASRKRNLRPQGAFFKGLKDKPEVAALFLALPERDIDVVNPYTPEGDYKYEKPKDN